MQLQPECGMAREIWSQVLLPAWKCYSEQHFCASSHCMCKAVVVPSEPQELLSVKLTFYTSMKYFDFFLGYETPSASLLSSQSVAVTLCCCYCGCVVTLISGLKGLSCIPLPLMYIPITNGISSLLHKSGTFLTAQSKGYENKAKFWLSYKTY